jgi:hypothetical protein
MVSALAVADVLQALAYMRLARAWAAGVDDEIVDEMACLERRLVDEVETLRAGRVEDVRRGSSHAPPARPPARA